MDRDTFHKLCDMLQSFGGLKSSRRVTVIEKVAMFLSILAHHTKNRCVKFQFKRSGQTVSKHFHAVLHCVLRMHSLLLVKPKAVTEDSTDVRWQKFPGCLGALDGTHVDVHVPTRDKGQYRNRKGNYYLCDNGYLNCEGFLTPYKGVRYHLSEWSSRRPQSHQEYFNMNHTRARNVIERTFGLLKMRWGILRSPSWYPIKTANKIIMACCLLHNYIQKEMDVDSLESDLDDYMSNSPNVGDDADDGTGIVDSLDATPEWTIWRDSSAMNMFNEWRTGHGV
ncbi:hypothetical protein ACS0TY_024520 [Phlomoides rotata]